jgi:hypothetical protein
VVFRLRNQNDSTMTFMTKGTWFDILDLAGGLWLEPDGRGPAWAVVRA